MFLALKVEAYYDGPEDVEHLGSFDTDAEARAFIQDIKDRQDASFLKRMKYIEDYVDKMEVPTDYTEYNQFVRDLGTWGSMHINSNSLKEQLKSALRSGHKANLEGFGEYTPPEVEFGRCYLYLFVLEVKDAYRMKTLDQIEDVCERTNERICG